VILSVCADKGAPGVTTLVTALGLIWPAERVVLEADVSGADLPFRLQHQDGDRLLDPQPSVLALAADVRAPQPEHDLAWYAQPTALGVPVVPGGLSAEAFTGMARLWPQVAEVAASWPGTVLADLGRLQPGDPAAPVAAMSTAVLLLARPDLEGLYHLRERVSELAATVGRPTLDRTPLAVVVRARAGAEGNAGVEQVRALLESIGSPVPVLGVFAEDPAAVAALRGRQLTRKLLNTDLLRSARTLAESLFIRWPQLAPPPAERGLWASDPAAPTATLPAYRAAAAPRQEPVEPAGEVPAAPWTPGWGLLPGLRRHPRAGQVSA